VSLQIQNPAIWDFREIAYIHELKNTKKRTKMKVIALLFSFLAVSTAFSPLPVSTRSKASDVALNALFDDIFNLDLFEPVKTQNDYGARNKKKLTQGKIGSNSYVPDGLTAAQYNSIRDKEAKKKAANYERNVKKAGKFENFTEFYLKRGTKEGGSWLKAAARGHKMVKTKYDWDAGLKDQSQVKPFFE